MIGERLGTRREGGKKQRVRSVRPPDLVNDDTDMKGSGR